MLTFEVPAGLVRVAIDMNSDGLPLGGLISAPQPLSIAETIPAAAVAACLGLGVDDVLVSEHPPVVASVGNPYVIAQIANAALARCLPDLAEFRRAREGVPVHERSLVGPRLC